MKKLFILAVIAAGFTMTSCKKDYTCSCTVPGQSAPVEYKYTKVKKADAETACKAANVGGIPCTLK